MPCDDYMSFVKVCPQYSVGYTEAGNHKSENAIFKYLLMVKRNL